MKLERRRCVVFRRFKEACLNYLQAESSGAPENEAEGAAQARPVEAQRVCIIGDDDEEPTTTVQPAEVVMIEAQEVTEQSTVSGTNEHEEEATSAEIVSEEHVSSTAADASKGMTEKSSTGRKLHEIISTSFQYRSE